jgi:hypothetical protein
MKKFGPCWPLVYTCQDKNGVRHVVSLCPEHKHNRVSDRRRRARSTGTIVCTSKVM